MKSGAVGTWVVGLSVAVCFAAGQLQGAHTATWDPDAPDYAGHKGVTFHVSKLGDNSDGLSWATAFTSIQQRAQSGARCGGRTSRDCASRHVYGGEPVRAAERGRRVL